MDFRTAPAGFIARLLALFSLFAGLADAAWILGMGAGANASAFSGSGPFLLLAVLCVTRLFAAVGLWIQAGWGAVVLIGALGVELALYLTGSPWIALTLWGFIFKLAMMLATIALVAFTRLVVHRQVAD